MKKILIIEDDTDLREALEAKCESVGYEVDTVETSEEGLQRAIKEMPDLIFLDIMTHSIHASAFIDRLRSLPMNSKCKIIVITNLDNEITKKKIEEKMVDAFYIKSQVSLEILTAKARELLGA
jgi:two-component system phosphate regulon response regulator PhoB